MQSASDTSEPLPPGDYPLHCCNDKVFPSHQTEINDIMHSQLVDWMVEKCCYLGIQSTTLCLSVHIMDEYIRRHENIPTYHFQLLGCACLMLSSKLDQTQVSTIFGCEYHCLFLIFSS